MTQMQSRQVVPVFPLETTFLPGDRLGLVLFEDRYLRLASDLQREIQPLLATVLITRGSEVGGDDLRSTRGILCNVTDIVELPDGRMLVQGTCANRILVEQWLPDNPYPIGVVTPFDDTSEIPRPFDVAATLSVVAQQVRSLLAQIADSDSIGGSGLSTVAAGRWWDDRVTVSELWKAYWLVARAIPAGPLDRHTLLSSESLPDALFRLRRVLEHTREVLAFQLRDNE